MKKNKRQLEIESEIKIRNDQKKWLATDYNRKKAAIEKELSILADELYSIQFDQTSLFDE